LDIVQTSFLTLLAERLELGLGTRGRGGGYLHRGRPGIATQHARVHQDATHYEHRDQQQKRSRHSLSSTSSDPTDRLHGPVDLPFRSSPADREPDRSGRGGSEKLMDVGGAMQPGPNRDPVLAVEAP